MRVFLLFAFIIVAAAANAGTLEKCSKKEKNKAGLASCVQTESNRSKNMLRERNLSATEAVNKKVQKDGNQRRLRQYRTDQARYVRNRAATCRKQPVGIKRQACEADMDYAHIGRLERLIRKGS
jgi:hypothetical protein